MDNRTNSGNGQNHDSNDDDRNNTQNDHPNESLSNLLDLAQRGLGQALFNGVLSDLFIGHRGVPHHLDANLDIHPAPRTDALEHSRNQEDVPMASLLSSHLHISDVHRQQQDPDVLLLPSLSSAPPLQPKVEKAPLEDVGLWQTQEASMRRYWCLERGVGIDKSGSDALKPAEGAEAWRGVLRCSFQGLLLFLNHLPCQLACQPLYRPN